MTRMSVFSLLPENLSSLTREWNCCWCEEETLLLLPKKIPFNQMQVETNELCIQGRGQESRKRGIFKMNEGREGPLSSDVSMSVKVVMREGTLIVLSKQERKREREIRGTHTRTSCRGQPDNILFLYLLWSLCVCLFVSLPVNSLLKCMKFRRVTTTTGLLLMTSSVRLELSVNLFSLTVSCFLFLASFPGGLCCFLFLLSVYSFSFLCNPLFHSLTLVPHHEVAVKPSIVSSFLRGRLSFCLWPILPLLLLHKHSLSQATHHDKPYFFCHLLRWLQFNFQPLLPLLLLFNNICFPSHFYFLPSYESPALLSSSSKMKGREGGRERQWVQHNLLWLWCPFILLSVYCFDADLIIVIVILSLKRRDFISNSLSTLTFDSFSSTGKKKRTSSEDTFSWMTNWGISWLLKVRYMDKTNSLTDECSDTKERIERLWPRNSLESMKGIYLHLQLF